MILEDELSSSKLDEDKNIIESDKIPLVLEGEFLVSSLVENNDLAIAKELLLEKKQVLKQHPDLIMENVLVGVEDFYFPIESLTFGIEEDRQVSFVEKPFVTTSQIWIDAENGELTLLVGEKKLKFNLHQRKPLTDEERRTRMKIKRSFPLTEE